MINSKFLIALDLDGTLLKDDKTISENTKAYLKNLEDKGNLIVITSGRAIRSVYQYYEDIGLKSSPTISYNGHYATNPSTHKFKIVHKINKETAKTLYSFLKYNNFCESVMSENLTTIFVDKDDEFLFAFYEKNNLNVKYGPLNETIDDDVLTFVIKIENNKNLRDYVKNLIETKFPDIKLRYWEGDEYGEIYKSGISKSKTIDEVADIYQVPKENIIVFGDANNDIEMLKEHKNSFLMKNGNPDLAQYASKVTEHSNNDDGVLFELKKIFN